MDGLISFENISLKPIDKEILALNEFTSQYGLVLTEQDARELSETRAKALTENDRIEIGGGIVTKIIEKFAQSKYITMDDYTYILNELTYFFYYIKTETDDRITDDALLDELFERFELYCRGSIDTLEGRELERIIRKINSGEHYYEWFKERDELDYTPEVGERETPENFLRDERGRLFIGVGEEIADHDLYVDDVHYDEDEDISAELDAFDEFLDAESAAYINTLVNPDAAVEDVDDDEEDGDEQ